MDSPLYVNKTGTAWKPILQREEWNASVGRWEIKPFPLAGVNASSFSLSMYNPDTEEQKTCTGVWSGDATNGFTYQWTDADLSEAGTWLLYLSINDTAFDPHKVQILPWRGSYT